MTDKWIYILNSLGWALLGMVLTLSYQRIAIWWHKRKGDKIRTPLSPQAYLGMIIIMISLVSAAFSGAGQIQTIRNSNQVRAQERAFQNQVACQTRINADNAINLSERTKRSQEDTENADQFFVVLNQVLQQTPGTPGGLKKIEDALTYYQVVYEKNTAFRDSHPLTLLTNCGPPVAPPKK